ncbi:hypothetical protein VC83_07208 [Pseudogymnoascus destructans]|uniref:Uncharacterized protein n=1 Tax=Pseudogymnoascus destructans TaxID=655981 RepID=A0A177A4I4_9PEZI|nr:uncharacterized protein VC83_07208 [Pseudogymnoascus destructans]OAF56520.1 hypothetical protein VC83_07208 [Pseudogymnoascus destructans]
MAISNFLNPSDEEEDIQDGILSQDKVLQEVIDEHLGLQQTQDDDEEELQLERSLHSVKSACQALQVLIEFTEEQEALQSDYLRGLEHLEFALEALDQESRVQTLPGHHKAEMVRLGNPDQSVICTEEDSYEDSKGARERRSKREKRENLEYKLQLCLKGAKSSWWCCRSRGTIILRIDALHPQLDATAMTRS